jgi:hypothetical protein
VVAQAVEAAEAAEVGVGVEVRQPRLKEADRSRVMIQKAASGVKSSQRRARMARYLPKAAAGQLVAAPLRWLRQMGLLAALVVEVQALRERQLPWLLVALQVVCGPLLWVFQEVELVAAA